MQKRKEKRKLALPIYNSILVRRRFIAEWIISTGKMFLYAECLYTPRLRKWIQSRRLIVSFVFINDLRCLERESNNKRTNSIQIQYVRKERGLEKSIDEISRFEKKEKRKKKETICPILRWDVIIPCGKTRYRWNVIFDGNVWEDGKEREEKYKIRPCQYWFIRIGAESLGTSTFLANQQTSFLEYRQTIDDKWLNW